MNGYIMIYWQLLELISIQFKNSILFLKNQNPSAMVKGQYLVNKQKNWTREKWGASLDLQIKKSLHFLIYVSKLHAQALNISLWTTTTPNCHTALCVYNLWKEYMTNWKISVDPNNILRWSLLFFNTQIIKIFKCHMIFRFFNCSL